MVDWYVYLFSYFQACTVLLGVAGVQNCTSQLVIIVKDLREKVPFANVVEDEFTSLRLTLGLSFTHLDECRMLPVSTLNLQHGKIRPLFHAKDVISCGELREARMEWERNVCFELTNDLSMRNAAR